MPFLSPDNIIYKENGNSEKEVPRLRAQYGSNGYTKQSKKSFLGLYFEAFGDPIIKILLVALALNLVIALKNMEIYEPLGIAVSLFLATFVQALSEYGSENAFAKLEKQAAATTCRVVRSGALQSVAAKELVVYDVLRLSAGERVPADAVIVKGSVLVDQSSINGESAEVTKCPCGKSRNWDVMNNDQLFSGTVITSGDCTAVVGRTGDSSLYGQTLCQLQQSADKSPLTKRLTKLASVLAKIGYFAAALVFAADLFGSFITKNGIDLSKITHFPSLIGCVLHALTLAITVLVVAVPEGLPMMITVVLSSNMQRLRRDNVLVRKLVGIETCGCVNILFCDKTGTLTCGKLTVCEFITADGKESKKPPQHLLAEVENCIVLSNESTIVNKKAIGGNATDRALLEYVSKKGFEKKTPDKKLPFNSTDKFSAARLYGRWYIKGAPEMIMKKCDKPSPALEQRLKEHTKAGRRVIALATADDMSRFSLTGLIVLSDKLRSDVRRSVATVKNAGINVCMVTGDNIDTAVSIATASAILTPAFIALTSDQMSQLSDAELAKLLPRLAVVARALPADKSRLVRVAKQNGYISAMTGDGINDAPALKSADVGFAMGSGTEVAKEAGDIVIADDNLSSIAKAILYGRTIFKSIRKFIVFQLTMNLCAVGVSVIGPFIGVDTPITVMQMLWINIIMDTLAGLAFAGEPPLKRYMEQKPIPRQEPVLTKQMGVKVLLSGAYNLALCLFFLISGFFRQKFGFYQTGDLFMTAFFILFVFSGLAGCLCVRSERLNILQGITKNKSFVLIFSVIAAVTLLFVRFGGTMLRLTPLSSSDIAQIVLLSLSVIPADALRKIFLRIEY